MAARTSLATWPITGRSSALSAPIPRKISVNAPFFPKYFTRKSFERLRIIHISATAPALRSSMLLNVLSSCNCPLFVVFYQQKKAFPPGRDEKTVVPPLLDIHCCVTLLACNWFCLTLYGITTVNRLPLLLPLCLHTNRFREPLRSEFRQPCSTETLSIYGASSLSRGTAYLSPSSRLLVS